MIRVEPARVVILRKMCDLCNLEMKRHKTAEKEYRWGDPHIYEYRCKNDHVDSSSRNFPTWEVRPMPKEKT